MFTLDQKYFLFQVSNRAALTPWQLFRLSVYANDFATVLFGTSLLVNIYRLLGFTVPSH